MKVITPEQLKFILKQHELWLNTDGVKGEKANLSYENLRNVDLRNADLRNANLKNVDLRNADLRDANLRNADFRCSSLRFADLREANLSYSDLRYTDLSQTDLRDVNLKRSYLGYANLRNADLRGASLNWCNTQNIEGQEVIAVQINNSLISYWKDLGIVTTGCFQGTMEELVERVDIEHKDNDKLRLKYHKAIKFLKEN